VSNWRHLVARTLLECLVESCAFSVSLPILISLKLMWLQWAEWLQKAQTWHLDSNCLRSPFYTPMLSPYYYYLWYYYPFEKSWAYIFSVSETYTPTQWSLVNRQANFVCTAIGTVKLLNNVYLKSPYLLMMFCAISGSCL